MSATNAELTAEFERAMQSLAERPVGTDEPEDWLAEINEARMDAFDLIGSEADREDKADVMFANHLTRIGAVALEGAARLRRGT